MPFRLSGFPGATLVSRRFQFNHLTGEYLEEVYEGTATAINALKAGNLDNPAVADILVNNDGPKAQAVVRYKGEDPSFETRLAKNRVTIDIFEHPSFRAISDEEKRSIRQHLNNPDAQSSPAISSDAAHTLYKLGLKGVTSYVTFQPVLTVVETAPHGFLFTINYENVGKIISSAAIRSISQAAVNVVNSLPDYLTELDDLIPGWLKHPPEVATVGTSKQSVIYEYEYGLWSDKIYEAAA